MGKTSFKKNANLFRGESNPFNIKVNRKKYPVLGSKVKGTKGLPVVSKGISHAKRKEFWQKSRTAARKSNHYFDKRLLDPSMPLEDRVTARFVKERQKKGKNNIFSLNDEEELTHKGQSLRDIKDFDINASGSEEDDETLGAAFVSKAHFGGFASGSNFETPKTHKELVEQLIMESKLKKYERKMEKEKYVNSQEMVDKEWKEIHLMNSVTNLTSAPRKTTTKHPAAHETRDVFDVSKFELKFEPKSSSITHGKTPEQIAKEEQEKKIKLEQERLARMVDRNELNNSKADNHLSADGIFDDFDYLQPVVVEDNNEGPQQENNAEDSDSDGSVESDASSDISKLDTEGCDVSPQDTDNNCLMTIDKGFSSKIPHNVENFKTRVKDCDAEMFHNVIGDILKTTIRSKNEKVLTELENFFSILLQYALECCEDKCCSVEQAGILLPHLHSLAMAVPCGAAKKFLDILDQEQQIFQECKTQNMKRDFPRLQTILVLKYSGVIYSASDFRHPVVTPSMILMCDILSSKFFNTYVNLVSRLLVSEIVLDCIAESKRLVPEAIHFLNYVLQLAAPEKKKSKKDILCKKKFNLTVNEKSNSEGVFQLDLLNSNKSMSEEDKKIGIISETVSQLHRFSSLHAHLPSFKEIFSPTLLACSKLPAHHFPYKLQESIKHLMKALEKEISLRHLVFQNAKPKPLKMFEPSFESKFNKKDDINRKRQLLKRVSQKIKKEEKGMLREIRRDAHVVASEKLKEKLELDAERKRKVKELYGELASQEGEYKKMMKKK